MSDAQTILKMIEEVSPDDTAKLDEIDARVFCYLDDVKFVAMVDPLHCSYAHLSEFLKEAKTGFKYNEALYANHKYTRSRDALKAIRPEGWMFDICNNGECYVAGFDKLHPQDPINQPLIQIEGLGETEELAELHAIIQAIEYERTHDA